MLKLHDVVRLKKENKKYGIPADTIGAIVDVLGDGDAYTVEFVDNEGNTYEDALFTEFREDELILVKQ
ncbi:MAG: DUF4926 domain-containing protein [Oscillospiraceae bacterium]|nr:DUF4926 domain-containing protein [Oscillospiraceae bacterium]